jgi:hypothetical protein
MNLWRKPLALALGAGFAMCLAVWLFTNEASPTYVYFMQNPESGYGLLILNLPALFVSRLISGTPPSESIVYAACFLQWFGIGFALSFIIWRKPAAAGQGVPADGPQPGSARR